LKRLRGGQMAALSVASLSKDSLENRINIAQIVIE
jgi:hypothetical protein